MIVACTIHCCCCLVREALLLKLKSISIPLLSSCIWQLLLLLLKSISHAAAAVMARMNAVAAAVEAPALSTIDTVQLRYLTRLQQQPAAAPGP